MLRRNIRAGQATDAPRRWQAIKQLKLLRFLALGAKPAPLRVADFAEAR